MPHVATTKEEREREWVSHKGVWMSSHRAPTDGFDGLVEVKLTSCGSVVVVVACAAGTGRVVKANFKVGEYVRCVEGGGDVNWEVVGVERLAERVGTRVVAMVQNAIRDPWTRAAPASLPGLYVAMQTHIMQHLPPNTLMRLAQTSRCMYRVATRDVLWQSLYHHRCGPTGTAAGGAKGAGETWLSAFKARALEQKKQAQARELIAQQTRDRLNMYMPPWMMRQARFDREFLQPTPPQFPFQPQRIGPLPSWQL